MEYRAVLAYYMEKRDISMAELARKANCPKSSINEIMKGRAKEPTLSRAKAIADALEVSLDEMARMMFESSN